MNAAEILLVLNGLEPVDTTGWVFCVVTHGAHHYWDNSAQQMRESKEERFWPFEKGEVLVLAGEYEREPFGEGRKPAKWSNHEHHFKDLSEALACREAVLAGTWQCECAPEPVGEES